MLEEREEDDVIDDNGNNENEDNINDDDNNDSRCDSMEIFDGKMKSSNVNFGNNFTDCGYYDYQYGFD